MFDNGINFYDDLINFRNINLIEASKRGYTSTVSALLECGHDINMKDSCNETALLKATRNGHVDIVGMLLEKGSDVNSIDENCYTVLMWACAQGNSLIVSMLLDKGVEVFARSIYNETALEIARRNGHINIVTLIEKHISAKLMKERILIALIIKKGMTQHGDNPLLRCAHLESIYHIASFF